MTKKLAAAMLALASLSGCAALTPPYSIRELKKGTNYIVNYDASRRGMIVYVSNSGRVYACSEPVPDVSVSSTGSLKATTPQSAGGEATVGATQAELQGRDSAVLLARDAMYRICEAARNGDIAADGTGKSAGVSADIVTRLLTAVITNTEASLAVAAANGNAAKPAAPARPRVAASMSGLDASNPPVVGGSPGEPSAGAVVRRVEVTQPAPPSVTEQIDTMVASQLDSIHRFVDAPSRSGQ